jgi:uncharacterized protein YcnI
VVEIGVIGCENSIPRIAIVSPNLQGQLAPYYSIKKEPAERYTVRVPTEGAVATTHVLLEIPAGLTVLDVLPHDGAMFETATQGDRITAITWKKNIPPKEAAEFVFRARNPGSGELVWKAHQHFADGTTADWVGVAGERRPAAVTKLAAAAIAGDVQRADADACAIETWLKGYDAAFNARDLPCSTIRTSRFTKCVRHRLSWLF